MARPAWPPPIMMVSMRLTGLSSDAATQKP
jgi:hypothetical protein